MSYFSFRYEEKKRSSVSTVAVFYFYENGDVPGELEESVESETNRALPPDRIDILCFPGQEAFVESEFSSLGPTVLNRLKYGVVVRLLVVSWTGEIAFCTKLWPERIKQKTSANLAETIVKNGFSYVVESSKVESWAPAGYAFRKPGGALSEVFLRAGSMFKRPEALSLVLHGLCRVVPSGIQTLYIDSSTILPIALALQSCGRNSGDAEGKFAIINFHSYSISGEFLFPTTDDYRILISASTSGSLVNRLVTDHQARRDLCHHLLYYAPLSANCGESVYHRESRDLNCNSSSSEISIVGEDFIATIGAPRPVPIFKDHIHLKLSRLVAAETSQASIQLNLSGVDYISPVSICSKLWRNSVKPFMAWVQGEVDFSVPTNCDLIISLDQDKKLALMVQRRLEKNSGRKINVVVWSERVLKIESLTSVLVVGLSLTRPARILSISRLLRKFPDLHRHYFFGFHFCESGEKAVRLERSLCISNAARNSGWSVCKTVRMGGFEFHNSWDSEREILLERATFGQVNTLYRNRLEQLSASVLACDEVFLPDRLGRPLALRPTSVLFDVEYSMISQVTVYMMVSAALQAAREGVKPDGRPLRKNLVFNSNPFQDSVLDPNVFSMYNDGIFHAAYLRACHPSELDYSSSVELSSVMSGIIIDVISRDFESVLEFFLALRTKRLCLTLADFLKIEESVASSKVAEHWEQLFRASSPF